MLIIDAVRQPDGRPTIEALEAILGHALVDEIDIAAAYVTNSGLRLLLHMIERTLGERMETVQFRWNTSFDYCRTEPVALQAMMALANSEVRVHDADFCLSRNCTPRVPFHPKTFQVRGGSLDFVLAGSGNVSRSGLSRGYEAGLSVGIDRDARDVHPTARGAIDGARDWFDTVWRDSTPCDDLLIAQYERIFERSDRLKAPTPTEDDIASDHSSRGALKEDDLLRLRACRHFWIEAGNITRNRGPRLPGNQLMMKRLTRVYFGFSPTRVPENSAIGSVDLSFGGTDYQSFSLTYSDNKMDKLILPIPGQGGPPEYDRQNLIFRRVGLGRFEMSLGSARDRTLWVRRSRQIGGAYEFRGGRQWGVF